MANPNTNYGEALTASIDAYSPTLRDNVLNHNSLLMRMNKKGNTTPAPGGVKLLENLLYAENGKN